MARYSSPYASSFSFGPGPISTALKALIAANVAVFLLQRAVAGTTLTLGLTPAAVVGELHVWQLGTYMFLHAGLFHILFNMLALWMFGGELERIWGTRYFLKFYFVTGIGAAALTVVFSYLVSAQLQHSVIIGASGAIYGLLLAYAIYFPNRPIYMYFVFPIPAKYFVLIMGAPRVLLVDVGGGRRRPRDPSRRTAGRVSVSEGGASAPLVGSEVPISEVEDQPHAQEVRRVPGRPRG